MKTHKKTITHSFELKAFSLEVPLIVEYSIENDGIGWYEYWGSSQYDAGQNRYIIENITWNHNAYSQEVNAELEEYLQEGNNYEETCKVLKEELDRVFEN